MNNRLTNFALTVIFFFNFNLLFSQIWVGNNATWHYKYQGNNDFGFFKIEQIGDTTIQSINCKYFKTTRYQFANNQNNVVELLSVQDLDTNFTYTSNDTVYYLNNDIFEVLYDFSANISDIWVKGTNGQNEYNCSSNSITEVSNLGTANILGVNYRTVNLTSPDSCLYKQYGIANEKFGLFSDTYLQHSLVFPIKALCDPITDETPLFKFVCFSDNDINYNPSAQDCEYPLNELGIIQNDLINVIVYPNPTSNILNLISPIEINKVNLFDNFGRKVASWDFDNKSNINELDVSQIPNSLYIIEIISSKHLLRKSIIIK